MPAPPRRLVVREDGVLATAIIEGGMLVLDLTKGSILWRAAGSIGQASFGAHPRLLHEPDGVGTWLDLDTGATQRVSIFGIFGEPTRVLRPFAVQPAGTTIYVSGDEIARFDGDPSPRRTAGLDLRFFQVEYGFSECRQGLWATAGGGNLVLDCGRVLRLSSQPADDLRYAGSLDGLVRIGAVHHSRRLDRFLTLPRTYRTPTLVDSAEQELWVHEPRYLGLERRLSWKPAQPGTPELRGLELFERPSGRLLIVGVRDNVPVLFAVDP